MRRTHHRSTLALAVSAALIPAAAATAATDLRTPDARDAGGVKQVMTRGFADVRSPDARVAVSSAQPVVNLSDVRSPDARDAVASERIGSPVFADVRSPDARDAVASERIGSPVFADVRSPDARDGVPSAEPVVFADVRSPDARDLALPESGAWPSDALADLRSPDARDTTRVDLGAPDVTAPASDGLDWTDVGIGAGGATLLLLSLGGGLLAVRRRAHSPTIA